MLDLELLKTLVCVADEGSFTRAAGRVHRTQSTVSQQVRKLEQAVGKTLLLRDRAGNQVAATADGELMLAYARKLLAMADEAELVLSAPRRVQAIRLGIPEDFDVSRLAALLAGFAASHPDIRLETGSGMSTDLKGRLAAGELDLALIKREPGEGPCLAAWPERLVWAGDKRLLQQAGPVPLVLFPHGCIYRKRMIYALESAGRPWRAAYHSQSLAGVQAAVSAGLGISLLPAFARLPEHGILGVAQGLAPAPNTELAIVGEARLAAGDAVANLVAVLKRAVGQDDNASPGLAPSA
ncbi:LysR substrate-binding domain-containing protein [Achromobacter ruhlandii]|uniref:LysR substrate-binding domain-containing protein n=1 Tax=Achromobacter ruhlandii TaxID=72557 RepID=UPI001EED9AD4|nr:LysR substrate-binding domain-containing protein [Achromobacter ruhlandii]MCZ8399310.1 LysR substrate-binding domain-containing protein [Achromobacter ruhlandii]